MSLAKRTNQIGSITGYIFIGVILAFGLMIAVYYVRQHSEQARKDQAIAIYEKQQADKKATETKNQKEPVVVTSDSDSSSKANGQLATTGAAQLMPETGIEIGFSKLFGIFALTTAIVGYISSRYRLSRSL
jgi:Flp pilus assembly protein TadB